MGTIDFIAVQSDLKVAVIGTGRIGSIVAQIFAEGYRSEVVAYDPFPNENVAKYVTYKRYFARSD